MKAGAGRPQPDDERVEEWDGTVVVWNATVARIPAASVGPSSADDATGLPDAKATPDSGEEAA